MKTTSPGNFASFSYLFTTEQGCELSYYFLVLIWTDFFGDSLSPSPSNQILATVEKFDSNKLDTYNIFRYSAMSRNRAVRLYPIINCRQVVGQCRKQNNLPKGESASKLCITDMKLEFSQVNAKCFQYKFSIVISKKAFEKARYSRIITPKEFFYYWNIKSKARTDTNWGLYSPTTSSSLEASIVLFLFKLVYFPQV